MKKFELTEESIVYNGITLYRIKALKSYPFIEERENGILPENQRSLSSSLKPRINNYKPREGDLGGFVQFEKNLSQEGNCWVGDNAKVYNNAKVYGNAQVLNFAEVFNDSEIFGNVSISGISEICGNTKINETFRNSSCDLIYNNIRVFGESFLLNWPIYQTHKKISVSLVTCGSYDSLETPLEPEIESYASDNGEIIVSTLDPNGWATLINYRKKRKIIRAGKFEGTVNDFIDFYNQYCRNKDDLGEIIKFLKKPISKKYRLTTEYRVVNDVKLFRIKALRSFSDIKKGSFGGFIENEDNLSHIGTCWISDDAKAFGNVRVFGDARIHQNASVSENAQVSDEAEVFGYADIYGNAKIFLKAKVFGNTKIFGNAQVYGNAQVFGDAVVFENSKVHFNARIMSKTRVFGNASLSIDTYTKTNQYITLGPINDYLNNFDYITIEKQSKIINIGNMPLTFDEFKKRYSIRTRQKDDFQLIMEFFKVL